MKLLINFILLLISVILFISLGSKSFLISIILFSIIYVTIRKLLINFILLLISVIFLISLGSISFLISIVHLIFSVSVGRFKVVAAYFLSIAITVDILGNIVCASVFNLVLIKQSSAHKFGVERKTVSKVLGYNELHGTLTKLGRGLVAILNLIEENHCQKAIS